MNNSQFVVGNVLLNNLSLFESLGIPQVRAIGHSADPNA